MNDYWWQGWDLDRTQAESRVYPMVDCIKDLSSKVHSKVYVKTQNDLIEQLPECESKLVAQRNRRMMRLSLCLYI